MKPLYICDIDGTVADLTHRLHFIKRDKPDWDAFHDACVDDRPIQPVIATVSTLRASGADVWFFSGRSDRVFDQTLIWLHTHLWAGVRLNELVMRRDGDYSPDYQIKRQFYDRMLDEDKGRLVAVFDDRTQVVEMWRSIPVQCFQVKPGDF